jgi:hypothetical protein
MEAWSLNISKPQNEPSGERCDLKCTSLQVTGYLDYEQKYYVFTRNEIEARAKYFQDYTSLIPIDKIIFYEL